MTYCADLLNNAFFWPGAYGMHVEVSSPDREGITEIAKIIQHINTSTMADLAHSHSRIGRSMGAVLLLRALTGS
ncbi:hypothetical protein BDV10DRAFT_30295 [Aspergillus recurvatus]